MEDQLQEIREIIVRVCLGENTNEERIILEKWLLENKSHEEFYRKVCKRENLEDKIRILSAVNVDLAWDKNQRILRRKYIFHILYRSLPYAAFIILAIGISWMCLIDKQPESLIVASESGLFPGRKQAELVMGNGTTLRLLPDMEEQFQENGTKIIIAGNSIDYSGIQDKEDISYNIVRTPLGGEYSIILSDGTEVLLNAMSELIYPVNFQRNERRVKLKGEACFKVKKDTVRPFYVDFLDCQVKVLGTTFNVKAYEDEGQWQTTLCSGCVCLSAPAQHNNVVLKPGQQACWQKSSVGIQIKEVDTDLFIAWTKGEFRFDNTPIEEIFRILQRWYKIDVFFENNQVRQEIFTGKLPRFDHLEVILDIMEKVSDVRFEMRGTTLIVR